MEVGSPQKWSPWKWVPSKNGPLGSGFPPEMVPLEVGPTPKMGPPKSGFPPEMVPLEVGPPGNGPLGVGSPLLNAFPHIPLVMGPPHN